ncbi:MAG: aryl-sulfate sulfotransferase [Bacteroidia bacterium]|nr:aryl-sulfate sulfotransferase [Bacteroidia bacterium]
MKRIIPFLLIMMGMMNLWGQNTVGLISHNDTLAYPGYNIIYPHNQPNVYLLNNCGQIVHTWVDSANFRPGNFAYLLEDGRLIRGKRDADISNDPIWAGGGGETIEILDWDGNVEYSYTLNDSSARLHHDFVPMPNGNILAIAWESIPGEVARQAGRDTAKMARNELWPDKVIEIDPSKDSIVWEWHAWDHIIQDHDSTKANYGDVGAHPELIDLNLDTNDGHPDWHHINSIDYNPSLDHIILSVPQYDEAWVIDHSTTTAEAAGHTGGNSGMGGDLIFRWGNPQAYRTGDFTIQKLHFQHDIHWIDQFVDSTNQYFGKIALFNNQWATNISTVDIFSPVFDTVNQKYVFDDSMYLPMDFDLTVIHPDPVAGWSSGLSSVQLLPNDNLLITAGRFGYTYELTPDKKLVWEYVTPIKRPNIASQGDTTLAQNDNLTFRVKRFPMDYPAFAGRDLTPKGWIELNPNTGFCGSLVLSNGPEYENLPMVFPNPTQNTLFVEWEKPVNAELFDLNGRVLSTYQLQAGRNEIQVPELQTGIYFLRIGEKYTQRVLINK